MGAGHGVAFIRIAATLSRNAALQFEAIRKVAPICDAGVPVSSPQRS